MSDKNKYCTFNTKEWLHGKLDIIKHDDYRIYDILKPEYNVWYAYKTNEIYLYISKDEIKEEYTQNGPVFTLSGKLKTIEKGKPGEVDNDNIYGYLSGFCDADKDFGIKMLHVNEPHRKMGIAQYLIYIFAFIAKECSKLDLLINPSEDAEREYNERLIILMNAMDYRIPKHLIPLKHPSESLEDFQKRYQRVKREFEENVYRFYKKVGCKYDEEEDIRRQSIEEGKDPEDALLEYRNKYLPKSRDPEMSCNIHTVLQRYPAFRDKLMYASASNSKSIWKSSAPAPSSGKRQNPDSEVEGDSNQESINRPSPKRFKIKAKEGKFGRKHHITNFCKKSKKK